MSNILFPDIWGTIGKVAAIEQADTQRNFLTQERDAKASAAPFIQKALSGDRDALNEVATRHPDTAMKLAPLLERMDATQRTRAKEAADFTASGANAILQADPAERPAIYAQILADGKSRGFDLSKLPPQYTPQLDPQLRTYRSMAIPMLEHFKNSGDGVQFAPPVGGGAGGDPAASIGGIESGGKYDAVGPVADAKGSRAYGKYQVMDFNVGPWTQEILGKPMTPQEFLANPQAQDAVFKAKFGEYTQRHGSPQAAARAWFAGEGGMNNPNARDVLGTSVAGYEKKFTAGMGGNPAGGATGGFAPPDVAGATSVPQGDGGPPGSPGANGPPQNVQQLRGLQLPPGARVALQKGVPIVKDGAVLYIDANGGWGAAPLPQRAEPKSAQPPPGYEPNPDGNGLRPIAGGPADAAQVGRLTEAKRKADEKAIPQTVTKGVQENLNSLKQLDRAEEELKKVPDSVGGVGSVIAANVPGAGLIQSRMDPEGVKLRAIIADIGSLKIHERSGAAVTASEFPRLKPFIPQISDDAKTVRQKLASFRAVYEDTMRDTLEYYGPNNGFREYTPATGYLGGAAKPTADVPPAQSGALFEARDAISKGAPREAVIERLTKMGVDPSGL